MKPVFLSIIIAAMLSPYAARAEISANFSPGAVIIGPAADEECIPATEGALRYSSSEKIHHVCDGSNWKKFITQTGSGAPPNPPPGHGYFVVSAGQWDGNMGGLSGANAKCLSDLTANDWLGKTDAIANGQLDNSHVQAFMCQSSVCQNVLPNVTYYFAVSGDPGAGGASFTSTPSGRGPNNTINWFGSNYFNGMKTYWIYHGTITDELWSVSGPGSATHCSSWSTNSSGDTGSIGESNASNSNRWSKMPAPCDQTHRLICMVHIP